MTREWQSFELAVAAFLQALDPAAKVEHDRIVPDADTGRPRQRDVWISTSIGGHIPIEILVSCKRRRTKLSQQDMDAFVGEMKSSRAHKGVIYSASGFTGPALEKAQKHLITCCTLLDNAPPPLPESLVFVGYCFREQFRYTLFRPPGATVTPMQALNLTIVEANETVNAATLLCARFAENRGRVRAQVPKDPLAPETWSADVAAVIDNQEVVLRLESAWAVYRAKLSSWLLNGSYALTEGDFKGSFSMPWIDQQSAHPGPGWERVEAGDLPAGKHLVAFYSYGGETEAPLRASLAAEMVALSE